MNSKERFIAVMTGSQPDRVPVFPLLMSFAAKRYGVSYREFASNGHILAEAQLNIRQMFGVDAITACSDVFRVSGDLGGQIIFSEDKPPHLASPLVKTMEGFKALKRPDVLAPKGRMAGRILSV